MNRSISRPVHDVRKLVHSFVQEVARQAVHGSAEIPFPDFNLDPFQKRVVHSKNRFIKVLAPAGAGKTKTLTAKALSILQEDPQASVLGVTFTNAAAREFQGRVEESTTTRLGHRLKIATLNSLGWELLRSARPGATLAAPDTDKAGLIYGQIKKCRETHPFLAKLNWYSYRDLVETSDLMKTLGFHHSGTQQEAKEHWVFLQEKGFDRLLAEKLKDLELGISSLFDTWLPFWKDFTPMCQKASLYTFDDQKYWALAALQDDPAARDRFAQQGFSHLLVDEFQDINFLDLLFVLALRQVNDAGLYAVGDDDQCIYEWRGCSSEFFRDLSRFSGSEFETIILERNYRCPANIITHASDLIKHNRNREQKNITPVRQEKANIKVISLPTAYSEMVFVCDLLKGVLERQKDATIALLSRKKCQLIPIQILLAKEGIPFAIEDDLNIFAGNAFEGFLEVLYLHGKQDIELPAPKNIERFSVLIDKIYKNPLSKDDREKLQSYLRNKSPQTLGQTIDHFRKFPGLLKGGHAVPAVMADKIWSLMAARNVLDFLRILGEEFKGFQKSFLKAKEDIFYSDPPFAYLDDLAVEYQADFEGFIGDLRRASAVGGQKSSPSVKVELMTVLRAKGREFHTVFLLGTNDGVWPNQRAVDGGYLEEERRLFYVGITRARQNLFFGVTDRIDGKNFQPSRFLREMGLKPGDWLRGNGQTGVADRLWTTFQL